VANGLNKNINLEGSKPGAQARCLAKHLFARLFKIGHLRATYLFGIYLYLSS